jgi:hypothetical protein
MFNISNVGTSWTEYSLLRQIKLAVTALSGITAPVFRNLATALLSLTAAPSEATWNKEREKVVSGLQRGAII